MNIEFVEIDQLWNEAQTNVWFLVDGESYGVAASGGDYILLDSEGYEILECNDHERILRELKPLAIGKMEEQV